MDIGSVQPVASFSVPHSVWDIKAISLGEAEAEAQRRSVDRDEVEAVETVETEEAQTRCHTSGEQDSAYSNEVFSQL